MAFIKSGWLHRQSTILRRWKKNWFDLWSDGRLIFYDDQQRRYMEDEIHMKMDCINIRRANACQDLTPPEGKGRDALLQIVCRNGRVTSLCAESGDSALAWNMAFQDVIFNPMMDPQGFEFLPDAASDPPLYVELNPTPQVFHPDQYGNYVAAPPVPANTTVLYSAELNPVNHVIIEERRRQSAGEMALGLLAGAATGLAIGSILSVF